MHDNEQTCWGYMEFFYLNKKQIEVFKYSFANFLQVLMNQLMSVSHAIFRE